ncbi:MAG: hypothetical protein P4L84_03485 [Isosphaeraceae bacterium]|nr:hypothetical protein [Isosphaeraceae bacterium]
MATDREVEETIARCVGIMVFYRNSGRTTQSKSRMAAEIREVGGCVREWHSTNGVVGRIVDSVKAELIARYGHELGVRLDGEFYMAFEGEAVPIPIRTPSMRGC